MSQSRIIIAISVTIVLSAIQVHVFAIADTSPYYLNDTQISTALNLARNSTQFQSLVEGYNYTFDGTFEYVTSINQTNSESKVYAMDFSLVKSSIGLSSVKFITVWIDPTYTKLLNITTSGISWWGGPGGPNVGPDLTSVCDKSPPCYLRYYSVPTEATSLCSAEMGCYEVGPNGHSIHLGSSSVPEFPFALPILVISLASIFIFYRIKFKF